MNITKWLLPVVAILSLAACGGTDSSNHGNGSGGIGSSGPDGSSGGSGSDDGGGVGGEDDPDPDSGDPGSADPAPRIALTFNDGEPIRQYTPGAAIVVPVVLDGALADAPVAVAIATSDAKVAVASPSVCYLSRSSNGDSCLVTVRTIAAGTAVLTASAQGYPDTPLAVAVGGTPPARYNYGQLQIGAFPSARRPSTTHFPMTAQLGKMVTLQASLTGFDQPLNGVPVLLEATAGSIVGNPQCNVDSAHDANHTCIFQLLLPDDAPANDTVTVTARVVGNAASYQQWNSPTVAISTTSAPVAGTIVLESLDGSAPRGMSTPLWAVLRDSSGVGDTVVTLNASNSNVAINPGVARTSGAYQKLSCTLSSTSPVCGFGVKGVTAGTASIGAATSTSYVIAPLSLTVNEPLVASRTFRFRNTTNDPVWVGITSGTSNSYQTSALISAFDPVSQGPNKMCGPSNPTGGCPRGSTCQQGGAYPDEHTTYFCYWDQPVPSNGYELSASGTESTVMSVSESSYDPVADITWSGNFFPREGCTVSDHGELKCAIASCGNASSGEACAPGTGGAPAVATLPEVTLQRHNTDYYDVSVIGGANVITSFGPDRSDTSALGVVPDGNGYWCGTAGASYAQNDLPASDWDLGTHVSAALLAGAIEPYSHTAQTAATKSDSYYQFVSTVTPREAPGCTASTACSTSGYVCGYDSAAVDHGSESDYETSCGRPLAWLSANQIWAMNDTASNAAPFRFSGAQETAEHGPIQLHQLFSCTAPTASGYDTSNQDAARTCGCTNWGDWSLAGVAGDASFSTRIAKPSAACSSNSTVGAQHPWTANVLPTIAWLKKSCPTCYTYPFDDMSSTFQCTNHEGSATGTNSVPYIITFGGHIPGR